MDKVTTALNLALDWWNSIPGHSWYVLGTLIAASGLTFIVMNFVKNHHTKVTGERLAKKLVYFYLSFWSTIMATAMFVITYGLTLSPFLPFLAVYMPRIVVLAGAIYTFGGNKAYIAITEKLRAWVGKKPIAVQPVPVIPAMPIAPEPKNKPVDIML